MNYMRKPRPRLDAPAACIFLMAVLVLAGCESESKKIRDYVFPDVDIASIPAGTYTGSASYHGETWSVETVVAGGMIGSARELSSPGSDYDHRAVVVLDSVVAEQKLNVDCVSGATRSSKLYLLAVLNSLTGETVDFGSPQ